MRLLEGQRIVVTGGAGFIGRKFCNAIAAHGGHVIVADYDINRANQVAIKICSDYPGSNAISALIDITDRLSIERLIENIDSTYGPINSVVNNAYPKNLQYGCKMEDVTYLDFCENVSMHLGGYFLIMQRFANYFKGAKAGNIINISSIYGVMAPRFSLYAETSMTMPVEYAAIKSGVIQLTRYFAQYLKAVGIRVNTLSPGGVLDQQPQIFLEAYRSHCAQRGMLLPEDLTGTLIFLLSDLSKYVNGQNIIVDDGFSL